MIDYVVSTDGLTPDRLAGFFVGWPNPPSPETHLEILKRAAHIVLAVDTETGQVVGFINAISDGVLSAYIPLLEVLPSYQKRGIGRKLVERMMAELDGLYMIDLTTDPPLEAFYSRFGLKPAFAMYRRDFARQSGK